MLAFRRVIILTVFASPAWAGLYLEPYVGYEFGTGKGDIVVQSVGTVVVDEKDAGAAFGAKVGYSVLGFAFGADYMSARLTGKDQTTPPDPDSKWKSTDIGLFAQFSLPMLLKFSATYFLSTKLKEDDTELTGSGFKLGVGFTMLPLISINLDMINNTYDDSKISGVVVTSTDVTLKTLMLSVSLPLDL